LSNVTQGRYALVTGASGFIGRHLVEAFRASGTRVIALTRPSSRLPDEWRDQVDRVDCSEWTLSGLRRALEQRSFDVAYHFASYGVRPTDRDNELMRQINVNVPSDLVRLCKERNANLLMTGSSAEYQAAINQTPLTEQSPLETDKLYGSSKAAGGMLAVTVARELGVRLRLLRLFNIYGPGEAPHRLLPNLVAGLMAGRRVSLTAGTQIRDFVYVADVASALLAADAQMKSNSQPMTAIWNVCTGTGHSVRTFASTVAETLGADKALLGFGEQPLRNDETPWLVGNADRIRAQLGWTARYDLAAGIRAALANLTEARVPVDAGSRRY
jgi:nucleoside-diphosphate-sugar epimerase